MYFINQNIEKRTSRQGFTLVEMIVVIAIMSVLMTAGAIGLGGLGGKGVTSGVATSESLFDEARTMAMGKKIRTCVLVAEDLPGNAPNNLRSVVVAAEETVTDTNSVDFGKPTAVDGAAPNWVISSRGVVLPEQTFFSKTYSKGKDGAGDVPTIASDKLSGAKAPYQGSYFIYEFNAEGICSIPGATFVVGAGMRPLTTPTAAPRVTAAGKSDFGGFTVWRNGQTSVFRSPQQINSQLQSISSGASF